MSKDNDPFGSGDDDKLVRHYDTILKESALLTTFSGILFGFRYSIWIFVKYFCEYT
jgi:hypothetical protein